ncbi:major capsid protein [Kushneria marisflavi]|uniref:major capsid protein n=1 Tax=Kushneria marisflavi TaxID=157779 RepID=UPI000E7315B1|nr:major capsid protein [Kushneria marisflavi]RKD75780.1 hypothetical protein C8D96_3354 [Kushneria marisflavi]
MATTRLTDVIVPEEFTQYQVQNTLEKTALVESGVLVRNDLISAQLQAGADSFTVPYWGDLGDDEADITNDDPDDHSTPSKLGSGSMRVRKSFLHKSWSSMNLAAEMSGSDPMARIQSRVNAYWNRQLQARLVATLSGVLADSDANHGGDLVFEAGGQFSADGVIRAAATLGDSMNDVSGIAMSSSTYALALRQDLIEFERDSQGSLLLPTFRGLAVIMDDSMPYDAETGEYITVIFGSGAVGYGISAPRIAEGTAVEVIESAGNGAGQQILHSRVNTAMHPAGYSFADVNVAGESPTIAELADPSNWTRKAERKAIKLAFMRHTL